MGYALYLGQAGKKHLDAKPLKGFGDYMHFYNFNRLHSTIGYTILVKFEITARIGRAA